MNDRSQADEQRLAIAQRLKSAREYMGLSQDEVAKTLHLSRPAISNIESGARKVEAVELDQLAALYRLTVTYLLTGEEVIGTAPTPQFAFLARALSGLTEKDVAEVTRFATFLKRSADVKTRKKPR